MLCGQRAARRFGARCGARRIPDAGGGDEARLRSAVSGVAGQAHVLFFSRSLGLISNGKALV